MDFLTFLLILLVAGLVMGWINNLAGAAGALGLIALEEAAGLGTIDANASLRLSALAIGVSGFIGFWSKGRKVPPRLWAYGLLTVPGAVLGAIMALQLPVLVYRITLAIVVLLVLLQQWRRKSPASAGNPPRRPAWLLVLLFGWLGVHMGFVQVGTGLIAILILSIIHSSDLVEVNAAKMVLVLCASAASTSSFVLAGRIAWSPALLLALGAGVGSFLASRWSVRKGHGAVKVVVILICLAILARLAWQLP